MSFMLQLALAVGLVALAAGAAGYMAVLRRAAFAAHALPMAAFPGAAAAFLFGWPLWAGLGGFALGGAGLLAWAQARARRDAATALLLSFLLALGALFLSLSGGYAGAVYGLLFGQVFGLGPADLPGLALGALLVPLALLLGFRPLLLGAVAPDLLRVQGGRPARLEALFLAVIALAAGFAVPVTGALLVFSLMLGPGAAACRLARAPLAGLGLAMLLALGLGWASLALAYISDWPMGFFTGFGAALLYLAAGLMPPRRPRTALPAPPSPGA